MSNWQTSYPMQATSAADSSHDGTRSLAELRAGLRAANSAESEYVVLSVSGHVLANTPRATKYAALIPDHPEDVADRGRLTSWWNELASISVEVRSLGKPTGPAGVEARTPDFTPGYVVILQVTTVRKGMQPVSPLTRRQQQVYELLLAGASDKRIAVELGLSLGTVHAHVRDVLKKFAVHSRVELIAAR